MVLQFLVKIDSEGFNIHDKIWDAHINPSRPDPGKQEKFNIKFNLKGLQSFHKTFWGTTKKGKTKNLS